MTDERHEYSVRGVDHHDGHEHRHAEHHHETGHGHDHTREHEHEHDRDTGRGHGRWLAGLRHRVGHLARPHSHDSADKVDRELETSREGVRTVWWSFAVLMATAILQAVVVVFSGSVALLGDTLHNTADALTAVPLAIAFVVGRRAATRRYTYGYGRAEDLAGVAVVVLITLSAAVAAFEAVDRLLHPRTVTNLGWVAAAAVVGFIGNEWVARWRIRVGRRIGSAALIADGLHARTDGFTSLAVLIGAIGVFAGFPAADPIIGLVITGAILLVLKDAGRQIYHRLMDAVDPALLDRAERALIATPGVKGVGAIRLRWIGHTLRGEVDVQVDHNLNMVQAHAITAEAEHRLIHDIARLSAVTVHADPDGPSDSDHHAHLDDHR